MFAKIVNGTIEVYPYNPKADHPNTTFPTGADHPSFDIYWVYPSPQNNLDADLYNAIEGQPTFNAETNRWEQTWDYVEKSAEEKRQAKYNPSVFLSNLLSDPEFKDWASQISFVDYINISTTALDAKQTNDWSVCEATLNQLTIPAELLTKIRGLVEEYGIPITI